VLVHDQAACLETKTTETWFWRTLHHQSVR
jgi:hypothetical protein